MSQGSLNVLRPLYDPDRPPTFSSVAGVLNARFDQYTRGSRHVYGQILSVLNHFSLEYYLFAGAVVGYVRNGRMPLWMDDLDIIIFEDQIVFFEEIVLPYLVECGFNCFPPIEFPGGGHHILGMQVGQRRSATVALTPGHAVRIPWTQVDVFYTHVDRNGFLRNKGDWGLYHRKNVPEDFARPGQIVDIEGLKVRLFSRYEDDIRLEYGDVRNNIVVHSHSEIFLRAPCVSWDAIEREIATFYRDTVDFALPGITAGALAEFAPTPGATYAPEQGESLAEIVAGVLTRRAATVRLFGKPQIFWVMDLKRLLPTVRVEASVASPADAELAAHLSAFIDDTDCAVPGVAERLGRHLSALGAVADAGAGNGANEDGS